MVEIVKLLAAQHNELEKVVTDIKTTLLAVDGPLADRMAQLSGVMLDLANFKQAVWDEFKNVPDVRRLAKLETEFQQDGEALDQRLNLDAERFNELDVKFSNLNDLEQNMSDGFHVLNRRVDELEAFLGRLEEKFGAADHFITRVSERVAKLEAELNPREDEFTGGDTDLQRAQHALAARNLPHTVSDLEQRVGSLKTELAELK